MVLTPARSAQHFAGQVTDHVCGALVGLPGPFGVNSEQTGRIVTASRGNNVRRNASVEQHHFMRAAEVVKSQLGKA
jgi:hypothetical protein